ncbi:MAG TPA: enoyl-CoA hydratase-related protein [Actinomycetota bacterium]|nr:enoyl-CoA hydratase-related protein [Actinomycetota bacterium]
MALVEVTAEGALGTLLLNRPDSRNALSVQMCEDVVVALHGLEADPEVRVVIVKGAGPVFCAGADFAAVGAGGMDFLPAFENMLEAVARCTLPTVASIHGAALGGGLQLATVCDFRVTESDAKLGIPSARLGILVNFENVQRLVLLAGVAVAKEVLMTSRTFSGDEAAHAGLVHRSVAPESLDDEVIALADQIARGAPLSVQGVKRSIQVIVDHLGGARSATPETVEEIDHLVAAAYGSEDLQEGIAAMSEKRPPNFTGT